LHFFVKVLDFCLVVITHHASLITHQRSSLSPSHHHFAYNTYNNDNSTMSSSIPKFSRSTLLFGVVVLFLSFLLEETSATATHESQEKDCKDHSHFNCHHIVSEGNCEGHAENGDVIGDNFCRVSCGRCDVHEDSIVTDQSCYSFGKQEITTSFSNRDPEVGDWVGIYAVSEDSSVLGTPVAWFWTCGNKRDKCKTSVGTVSFPWLPPGEYRALMGRHVGSKGFKGPINSYAESEPFEVVRGNSCTTRLLRINELEAPSEQKSNNLRGS
jgi:hypothetical protein